MMQDLVGRLSSLDPEASQSLAVIAYFDRMLESGVSVSALVRGAALLSGASVGYRSLTQAVRFALDGRALEATAGQAALTHRLDNVSFVWLERSGRLHANDELVLERLSLAIGVTGRRPRTPSLAETLEALLQPAAPVDASTTYDLLARLRLAARMPHRAVASALTSSPPDSASAVLATQWGPVRATVVAADADVPSGAGIGRAAMAEDLHDSWDSALFALRVGDVLRSLRADDYGPLRDFVRLVGRGDDQPEDVVHVGAALEKGWSEGELLAIAEGASLRGIADVRGLHHSSIAARMSSLVRALTFDPATPLGRTRLHIALTLRRALTARFPDHP